ncbi:MAG: glycosyltransferase family 9 protein [Bacteroidetes bacterium]|nr:glycosyltransferase family 9 protein [Bacteroidota bacterium]MBS1740532.1 glycosyltransferase family 9 protein [Bacteroidota bacterium]
MHQFLIIQTSFIGDVVLATAVMEKLHQHYPNAIIDILVRNGNESLLKGHPFIRKVLVWNKSASKSKNLLKLIQTVRSSHYTHVINLHRFASTGLISFLSGAKYKAGFDKNPFSFCYNKKVKHVISEPYSLHPISETERNQQIIADLTDKIPAFPALYPTSEDYARVRSLQGQPYICIAPASVWFTKQFPAQKWIALLDQLPSDHKIFLLGGRSDEQLAKSIISNSQHRNVSSLCGSLSFLQSAALMQGAVMNYVNDSGPLHFASAVHAPVTAVFCSTVPAFGFGPLRDNGRVVEIKEKLYCRPCGLHGHKVCPEGHFRCALDIETKQLLWWTSNQIS